jgi:two-component system NarL family sensor kinase
MVDNYDIKQLIVVTTAIFLLAPGFLLVYIILYNRRKQRHINEKLAMEAAFTEELTKAQLEVQEQTLQTIGTELHDNIGQLLSLTSLTLKSIDIHLPDKAVTKIDAAVELTTNCIREMRLLGKLLQGEQLVHAGLEHAINQEAGWLERTGKFKIDRHISPCLPRPDSEKDLLVFRMLQELLNNCIKHAHATEIVISLLYVDRHLILSVADNGIGFDMATSDMGMGLENIKRRSKVLLGKVDIRSVSGSGTSIKISIPYGAS